MQTQTAQSPLPGNGAKEHPDDFSFTEVRPLKRAMRAVAAVLGNAVMIGNKPYCRLFTRANEAGVFVVATDGYRLHSMHLNATAHHEQRDFDEPLGLDVIRHIAKTRSDRIGISVDKDRTVVHEGSATQPYRSFPPTETQVARGH